MADFLSHKMNSKGTKPTTQMVPADGTSSPKVGGPSKTKPTAEDTVPPGGSPFPKKGTGADMNFGSWKKQAATPITTSAISAAK